MITPVLEGDPLFLNFNQSKWLSWATLCQISDLIEIDPFLCILLFIRFKTADVVLLGRHSLNDALLCKISKDDARTFANVCAFD